LIVVLVDTNVLAYLLIEGDHTAAAQDLYARDADWQSEAFALVEFTNILATYARTGALTREQGTKLLAEAETLLLPLPSVLHQEAYEAAIEFGISAYDARFITLARQMKSKLVTEDGKLRKAVPAWTISLSESLA
jgi:predicted nucleic acid-binding protein